MKFWGYTGLTLWVTWDDWGYSDVILRVLWGHFEGTLESLWIYFWDYFKVTLGIFFRYSGVTLRVLWGHFEGTLGSF